MAARLRSDTMHPCHHLSEPLRNMFWCRHCMKIFSDPIERWRHSKTCREAADSEDGGVSKQVSLKEGTLFRFGVWDADQVISRPKTGSSQYGIRIAGQNKVASNKGIVNPNNFDLQCVICRQPFGSFEEMKIHVKTPCSKPPNVQNVNRFPAEITNVYAYSNPPVLVREDILTEEISTTPKNISPNLPRSAESTPKPKRRSKPELFRKSAETAVSSEPQTQPEIFNIDETDGLPLAEPCMKCEPIPNDPVPKADLIELSPKSSINDFNLVKLDGKIPKLQLSPVDISSLDNVKDTLSTCDSGCRVSLKRRSSGSSNERSQVKKYKAQDCEKNLSAQDKKKPKRKKVTKKKSAKKKKGSQESKNSTQIVNGDKNKTNGISMNEEMSLEKEVSSDDQGKEETSVSQTVEQRLILKKTSPRKPPRPRKCKICGRMYKSLEVLQRHNKLPCRVKLTRNQCAKVLRSNSQTSESGRISRHNGQKPVQPKIVPKKRPKKKAKRYPPPFRGNPRYPQYRLIYDNLSEKEQFFFQLNMVPIDSLTLAISDAKIESLQIRVDESMPMLEKELPVLSSIELGDLFVSDDHVLPPQLEKISSLDAPLLEEEDDVAPPKLEIVTPKTGRNFMDMISPSAEKALKSVFTPASGGPTDKSKYKHTPKARRDRYSILAPISSQKKNQKKEEFQYNCLNSDKISLEKQRASQRLKNKALAKEPLDDIKTAQHSSSSSSPRKSLFESLSDISPEKSPCKTGDIKFSSLNENENKLIQNISVAKSRLGQLISPDKEKILNKDVSENKACKRKLDLQSESSRCTRLRKLRSSSDGKSEVVGKTCESVIGTEVATVKTEHLASDKQKQVRKSRVAENDTMNKTKDMTKDCNTSVNLNPPTKLIKLPLLASRGFPRRSEPNAFTGQQQKKTAKQAKPTEVLKFQPKVKSATCQSGDLKSKLPVHVVSIKDKAVLPNNIVVETNNRNVQPVIAQCEETILPSLNTECLVDTSNVNVQEIPHIATHMNDIPTVVPSVGQIHIPNCVTMDVTEKVTVQYIDEVVDYSEIALIGDECIETVSQPEGSCTTNLDYVDMLDLSNHSLIMDGDDNLGVPVNVITIEPQFQTIQFS